MLGERGDRGSAPVLPPGPSSGEAAPNRAWLGAGMCGSAGCRGIRPYRGGHGQSTGCPQPLGGRLAEDAPSMEAAGEGPGLVAFPHQPELAGMRGVLGAHVLDVNLERSTAVKVPSSRPPPGLALPSPGGGAAGSSAPPCTGQDWSPKGRWRCPNPPPPAESRREALPGMP